MQDHFGNLGLSGQKEMLVIVIPFSLNTYKVWTVITRPI